jgi:folate-binding protein YgfZ
MTPAIQAARDCAAAFAFNNRTHIAITGGDRAAFLHNFCTNDLKSLQPGQGCEAFICNAKGHVVAHVMVFVAADALWLETVPGAAQKLMAHLERYIIREDVALHDRTRDLGEACVVGPNALDVICRLLGETEADGPRRKHIAALPAPGNSPGSADGCGLRVVDWLGARCYLPVALRDQLAPGLEALSQAGATLGAIADWESLRIDAGFPSYGVDITEDNLPQEVARNEKCLSFTKGCYLGQEPIARLDALGHTNRELRRLLITGAGVPAAGTGLVDAGSGHDAGRITSAAPNPFGDGAVALGYVKSKWFAAGTRLHLATDAKHEVLVR